MKYPLVRTIYLYLFALVGLALMSVGAVQLVKVGLKATIFTKADDMYHGVSQPPMKIPAPYREVREEDFVAAVEKCQEKCELSEDQKNQIASWLRDYRDWQNEPKTDFKTQQRQRELASAISLLIIGLPLYLYHWGIIRKEKHST
jgi:hypothetical protein